MLPESGAIVRPSEEIGEAPLTGGEPEAKTLRSRETILSELAAFTGEFERLVMRSHDRDALLRPAADGGWGVVEILAHLRDWDEVYTERVHAIVEIDRPQLPSYDDSLWSIERDYRGQDPVATLADLAEIRNKTVDYLKALPGNAWQRQGVFETDESIELWQSEGTISGTRVITLQWLGDQMCDHDREHLNQALHAVAS
jgi:hypothetical protein